MSIKITVDIPCEAFWKIQNATAADIQADLDSAGEISTTSTRATVEAVQALHPSELDQSPHVSKPAALDAEFMLQIWTSDRMKPLVLSVHPSTTTKKLKIKIHAKNGVVPSHQTLRFGTSTAVAGDDMSLRELNVGPDTHVLLEVVSNEKIREGYIRKSMTHSEDEDAEYDQSEVKLDLPSQDKKENLPRGKRFRDSLPFYKKWF